MQNEFDLDQNHKMTCIPELNPHTQKFPQPKEELIVTHYSSLTPERLKEVFEDKKTQRIVLPRSFEKVKQFFAATLEAEGGAIGILEEYDDEIRYLTPEEIYKLHLSLSEEPQEHAAVLSAFLMQPSKSKKAEEPKPEPPSGKELKRLIFEYENEIRYLTGDELKRWLDVVNSHIVIGAIHGRGMKSGLETIKWETVPKKNVRKIKQAIDKFISRERKPRSLDRG